MTDKIQLKVETPVTQDFVTINAETKKETTEKRAVEFISQGNHTADLTVGNIIETESREFADFLVHTLGLTEISPEPVSDTPPEFLFENEYPADFPHRKIFVGREIRHQTAIGLNREQLIAINGIGPKSADEVLSYINADGDSRKIVEAEVVNEAETGTDTEAETEENNGGEV